VRTYVCVHARDSGRAAAHAPLATVSLATLVRRRVRRQLRRAGRLFTALDPVTFPCKEARETSFRFSHQRQDICRQGGGGHWIGPLEVTQYMKQC